MFTPAPWRTEIKYHKNGLGSSCKILAGFIPGDARRLVATINSKNPLAYGNSNVLVAAPDLLAACKEALQSLVIFREACASRDMITPMWVNDRIEQLTAVIEKAEGGQS
jgi:hypothetical protein